MTIYEETTIGIDINDTMLRRVIEEDKYDVDDLFSDEEIAEYYETYLSDNDVDAIKNKIITQHLTLSEIQDIMDECKYILDHYKD
jgi:predicted SAM-dependent methyltransferase